MNKFFEENYNLVFQEWIHPTEVKDARVLDLGSQSGLLGEYCVTHGAAEYVGVDIDEYQVNEAKKLKKNCAFFLMDLEDYVQQCVQQQKVFDIVVISRTIHGVQNQVTLLQNLSKITNQVVIESGVPLNKSAYQLLEILKDINVPEKYKSQIADIEKYIEYDQPFVEYVPDSRWPHPVPSIGFFKEIFSTLGFELSLDTYESVKIKYPEEYGYSPRPEEDQQMRKSVLKFKKINNTINTLSWKEWNDTTNTSKMKYIGNFLNWIKEQKIIEHLDSCKGDYTPVWQPDRWTGHLILEEFKEMARPGYSTNKHFFHQMNPSSREMQDFNFKLPELPEKRKNVNWWFVMLHPGEFQAMHIDPQLTEVDNPVRYTMFLQDWEPGHVFVFDDEVASNYKAGDVFEWSDPMIVHGPANIGYNIRYTLQITMYD